MNQYLEHQVAVWLSTHHTVIGRQEALQLGMTAAQIRAQVRAGRWDVVHPGVYRLAGGPKDA